MTNVEDSIELKLNIELTLTAAGRSGAVLDPELRGIAYAKGWQTFWLEFIERVVHPGSPFPAPVYVQKSALVAADGDIDEVDDSSDDIEVDFPSFVWSYEVSRLATANVFRPNIKEDWIPSAPDDELQLSELSDPIPAMGFLDRLTSSWVSIDIGTFAEAYGYTLDADGNARYGMVVQFRMDSLEVLEGSFKARAQATLRFVGTNVLLPLALATATGPVTTSVNASNSGFGARAQVEQALKTQHVKCKVEGSITYDRVQLVSILQHRLSDSYRGICEIQSALTALGYNVGDIDGTNGPNTVLAAKAFAIRYGLPTESAGKRYAPVFVHTLAKALTGEPPPQK